MPDEEETKFSYMLNSRGTPKTGKFTKFEGEKMEEQTHKNTQTLMEMKWNQGNETNDTTNTVSIQQKVLNPMFGKNMEQWECLHTAGGGTNWCHHFGKCCDII